MPAPHSRRIRYALVAACAAGAIGVGYAGIAAAQSSSDDRGSRLASTTSDNTADGSAEEVVPSTTTTEPSLPPSATASPTVSVSPSARPSRSAVPTTKPARPAVKPTTKRPTTKAPTKTTRPAAPSGGSAVVSDVIRLVNAERKKAGCGSLAGESRLHAAAQKHSDRQAKQNSMSHQLPGEASMGDRVTAEGYRWGGVAENVAAGYTTPASVMDGWMNSSGHKANILNCGYKHIGVGVKKSSQGTLYWTQVFASPR